MTKRRTDKATLTIYSTLLERFGEPIGKAPQTIGVADEGPGGKALWKDEPKKDRHWSDPTVVKENVTCNQCGKMPMQMDQCSCSESEYMDENMNEAEPPQARRWFVYNHETGTDLGEYMATSKEDALAQFKADLESGEELDPMVTATTRDEFDGPNSY